MARIQDIKNQWGVSGGPNPQRSDLWQVDLEPAISGINQADIYSPQLMVLPRYVLSAVSLPELRVKAEAIRRDSNSYNMPSWDDPLDPVKISFVMDDGSGFSSNGQSLAQSEIYKVLDTWRRLVRGGRGAVGGEPAPAELNDNYQLVFRFPIYAYLIRGSAAPPISFTQQSASRFFRPRSATQDSTFETPLELAPNEVRTRVEALDTAAKNRLDTAGLEVTNVLHLVNAWLGGFKVGDMAYDQGRVLTIDATFYAENICHYRRGSKPPQTL